MTPTLTRAALAAMIDHTLLTPQATDEDVRRVAAEGAALGVAAICVSPSRVVAAVAAADGTPVCAVAGFPSGAHAPDIKAAEAERAVGEGAAELDMVIDLGRAAAGDWGAVTAEVAMVHASTPGALLKVILETALLDEAGIVAAARAAAAGGADFVKTSTGFSPAGGADEAAVSLLRATVGERLGVKASGGIRTTGAALAMLAAGASRLGLSATATVLGGLPA